MEFQNKVAVITGAGSGIGRAMALALAKLGMDIVIADIDYDRLAKIQKEIQDIGRRAFAIHCDVSKNTDVEKLAKETLSNMGTVDFLFNNAGIGLYGKFENMRFSDYEKVLQINLFGVIRGVMAFLPFMVEKGSGYIINTASQVGIDGGLEPYPFSKYAVVGYSERLYMYARPKGVMVSVLCPGLVKTNIFFDSPFAGNEQEQMEFQEHIKGMDDSMNLLNPENVAQIVIDDIKEKKFFILTPGVEKLVNDALDKGRDIQKMEKYLQENFKEPNIN